MAENINVNFVESQNNQQTQNASNGPVGTLPTNRNIGKYILFSILTLGIYDIVMRCKMVNELNTVARDGKKAMNYFLALVVAVLLSWVFGVGVIFFLAYSHVLYSRVGDALRARGIDYNFGAGTFWGWNILGVFILVGPFVFIYKLIKAQNLLNEDYNIRG